MSNVNQRLDQQKGTIQLYERLKHLCRDYPYDFEEVQKLLGQTLSSQEINEIIYWSVKKDRIDIIEFLVETYEVKLMQLDESGQTAIHMAVDKNFSEAVEKLMLKTRLDENLRDANGLSYFHIACSCGMFDVVKKFIDMGIDANLGGNQSPLEHALIQCYVECSNKYIRKGKEDLDCDVDPEIPKLQSMKILELLLKCGVDPNVGDHGRTALHTLIIMSYNTEPSPIIFDCGRDAGRYFISTQNIGKSILYMNSGERHLKYAMKLLLEHGVDVNAKDKHGSSALNIAVSLLQYDAVYLLLKNGADVSSVDFREGYFNSQSRYELDLDLIERLSAIIELLESNGFVLSADDDMNALRFLMGRKIRNHEELTPNACVLLLKSNLLEFYHANGDYQYFLKSFLQTVHNCNIFLSSEKRTFLYNYLNLSPGDLEREFSFWYYGSNNEQEEVDIAKKTMISDKISLYDLCVVNPKKRYYYLKNASYKEHLNEHSYHYQFRLIGKIIEGLIAESYRRSLFERIAIKYFQILTSRILPDLCCECIIDCLSIDDLLSVCEAVTNSEKKSSRTQYF